MLNTLHSTAGAVCISPFSLKAYRSELMLNSELANLSDLPICEIDDILENGRAPVSYISKLAAALDVTIKYLTELEASEINQEKLNSQLESTKIVKITMELHILNANGLDEAYKQIKLLSKIPEYRNDNNSED